MIATRTKWVPWAALITLLTLGTLVIAVSLEPRIQGRTANEWFDAAIKDPGDLARYGKIFADSGGAGVEYLGRQLVTDPPNWKVLTVELYNRYGAKVGLGFVPPPSNASRKRTARLLLGYLEDRAAPELIRLLHTTSTTQQPEVIQAMAELGPVAAPLLGPPLIPLLQDSSVTNVYETITTLAVIGYQPETVVPLLVPFLQHTNKRVRVEASYALSNYPAFPAVTLGPLLASLNDPDTVVRSNAARALGLMGTDARRALQPLRKLLHSESLGASRAVEAIALIAGNDPAEVDAEYRQIHLRRRADGDRYGRLMVLHASARLGWSIDDLDKTCHLMVISQSNWQVWEAVDVMAELDPRPGWVKPLLETAAKHPNALVRAKARRALTRGPAY
ncbi:hypothetical protein GC207_07195 [bacterium]|nr:hypothetical protein [bacterium]